MTRNFKKVETQLQSIQEKIFEKLDATQYYSVRFFFMLRALLINLRFYKAKILKFLILVGKNQGIEFLYSP